MSNKAKMPPVPPANVSPAGTGSSTAGEGELRQQEAERNKESRDRHLGQQGRQGDIRQNTHHQGYQQDR